MKEHKISWLNMPGFIPETWNPVVGCNKVSPGCDHCYAEKFAFRIVNMTEKSKSETYHVYQNAVTKSGWTGRTALNTDHIDKPLQWKSPRMIFVCSMGDLFHEHVPFRWIDQVFEIINQCPQHIFILLTKRPENMVNYLTYNLGSFSNISQKPDGNTWWGVTAENQEQANKRIPILLKITAAKRFVSIEPMLGPVDLNIDLYTIRGSYSLAGSPEVDDLTKSLSTCGTVAAKSNLSLEQTVGVLETLAERQLKGEEAGTQFKTTLISLKAAGLGYTSGVFNMRDAIVELKAKIDAKSTALEKDNELIAVFGKRNITVGTILLTSIDRFDYFTKAVTGTSVDFEQAAVNTDWATPIKNLDWVICGGESGPKARPMHSDWVRSVRDQCQAAEVPFFFKQWGEWLQKDIFYQQNPNWIIPKGRSMFQFSKVGRKAAGDLLDGVQHHEWPLL